MSVKIVTHCILFLLCRRDFSQNLVTSYQQQGSFPQAVQPGPQLPVLPNVAMVQPSLQSHGNPVNLQLAPSDVTSQQGSTHPQMSHLPKPDNPVLYSAFYQAVRDQNTSGKTGVDMDDIRNVMMSQGRSAVGSRNRNPLPPFPGSFQQQ